MALSTLSAFSSLESNTLSISSKYEEILKITGDGQIFYKFNNEMIKVNCPDDITEAFLYTVLEYTGKDIDDAMIEKFIEKIENAERSIEFINKLEKIFIKLKLKKLNKI